MLYLLLIYQSESDLHSWPQERVSANSARYQALTEELTRQGKRVGGHPLEPTVKAKTVRVRHGKVIVTPGPFAETKEQLLGFYLVESQDFKEAAAIAAQIPTAETGSIEVRPILNLGPNTQ